MAFFEDRIDAGKKLAEKLSSYRDDNPVLLAIPRGGAVVAAEAARALKAPLSLIIPRKIGAPYDPEYAIGAVAEDGSLILDKDAVAALDVSSEYIEQEKAVQIAEIRRRKKEYGAKDIDVSGRTVILIDDGIATGSTILAAAKSIRHRKPKKIVVAVPVAPPEAVSALKGYVDDVVCLYSPHNFGSVGRFYRDFPQTSDEEVKKIICELG
jgi:putative phosphoribosyl transferase